MNYFKQIILILTLWSLIPIGGQSQATMECHQITTLAAPDQPLILYALDFVNGAYLQSLGNYKPEDFTITFTDGGGNVLPNYFIPVPYTRIINYKLVYKPLQDSCSNKLVIIGTEGTQAIVCQADLHFSIMPGQTFKMLPSDFLESGYINDDLYDLVIKDLQGNVVANNIISYHQSTKVYQVQVIDKSNGNKCWSDFKVTGYQASHAKAVCKTRLDISLDANGRANLPAYLLNENSSNFVSLWSSKTEFTCEDVNTTQTVKLFVANTDDIISQCTCEVNIQDKLAPVVVMKSNVTVHVNGITPTTILPEVVANYYDNCGFASVQVIPNTLDCNSTNPTKVTLIAKDKGGATVTGSTYVYYTVNPGSSILVCNDEVEIEFNGQDTIWITPQMVLEGSYSCGGNYEVTISQFNITRPKPFVVKSDIGNTLQYRVTNKNTGNNCWGNLIVSRKINCTDPFVVCDTECPNGNPGSCSSSYTVSDNLDWPCSFVSYACDEDLLDKYTPEDLINLHGIPKEDVYPQIINYQCDVIEMGYTDQSIAVGGVNSKEKKVIRSWTVLDWLTGEKYNYIQVIQLLKGISNICDTLPWDAPLGDCTSGHTDQDALEWPADITVSGSGISLNILKLNPDVHVNNVEPRIIASCSFNYKVTFTDQITEIDANTTNVIRTWRVNDQFNNTEATYNQKITLIGKSPKSTVCATTFNGTPIADVDMNLGTTSESGCADINFVPNVEIKPSKAGNAKDGVDIMDLVMAYEHILGLRVLNPYQLLAANVSGGGGGITTLDLVLLKKVVEGVTPNWDNVPIWKFIDKNHTIVNGVITPHKESINTNDLMYSNQFLGIKMGDIDGSYREENKLVSTYAVVKGTDTAINKGETYELSLKSDRTQSLVAVQLEFDIKDKGIIIKNVDGSSLPGFDPTQHVKITEDKLIIQWYINLSSQPLGVGLKNNQEMVKITYVAAKNSVLSDILSLNMAANNSIKQAGDKDPSDVSLHWESKILNDINNYVNSEIQIYPNPFTNKIQIQGIDSNTTYTLMDAMGNTLINGKVQDSEPISLSDLANGCYFIKLQEPGKNPSIHKLIKVE
jgi:hypothetical protein